MKKSAKAAVILLLTIMVFIVSCGEDPFFHYLVIKNDEGKTVTTIVVPDGDYKLPEKVDGLEGIEEWIYEDKEYSVGDVISVTKDSEITAITGTVIMVDNGDGTTQRVVVKKGETTLTLPKTPAERSGYVFDGWLVNGTLKEASATVEYTEGMKIEAKWTVVYTITYDANGGTGTVAPTLLRVDAESVEISGNTGFSKNGLFFSSWNTQADGKGTTYRKGDTYNKKENITLYAIWTDFITVTYYNGTTLAGEDAGKPSDLTLRDGSTLTAPTGTEFDAWYTKSDFSGECYSDNKALTESVTLYAHFVDSNLDYSIAGAVKAKTTSITSATVPSVYKGTPITMIAANGFQDCNNLATVELPSSLRTISIYAFKGCSALTSLTLPDGLTTLKDGFIEGTGITSITIPASVTNYSNYTFFQNGLKSIEFKGGITSITANMFSCCSSLESVTLPDSLTSISSKGFYKCTSLKSIDIPESVTSIAGDAFSDCTNLKTFNMGMTEAEATTAGFASNKPWGAADDATVNWDVTFYNIGDTGPAGGIVFYDAGSPQTVTYTVNNVSYTYTWRYLEAAPENLSACYWGSTIGSSDTSTEIGTGKRNTAVIISKTSEDSPHDAAKACDDYVYPKTGDKQFYDWFLPSRKELIALYDNIYKNSKISNEVREQLNSTFWTSSQRTSMDVYCGTFSTNYFTYQNGNVASYSVRPIRSFV